MPLAATLSAHYSGIAYGAPSRPVNANRKYSVFLPYGGRKPADGWDWVVHTDYGAWIFQSLPTQFTKDGNGATVGGSYIYDAFPFQALHEGIAIIAPTFTTTGQAGVAGLGTFKPPTHADFSLQDAPETDALQLVQKVVNNAKAYGLNPDHGGWVGNSSGAGLGLYSMLGAECVGVAGFHVQGSTRIKAVAVSSTQALFNVIDPTSSAYLHFPNGVDHNNVALTVGAADPSYLEMASPLRYASDVTLPRSSDVLTNLKKARMHLACFNPCPIVGAFAPAPGPPLLSANPSATAWNAANYAALYGQLPIAVDPYHNAWQLFALKQLAVANGCQFGSTGGLSRLITTEAARHLSTWAVGANAAPFEDKVMPILDLSAEGDYTQERVAWFKAVFKSL